jgi:hypothetical protein
MSNDTYLHYLSDLVDILMDKLKEIEIDLSSDLEVDKVFLKGQIFAYYDTLTIIKSQAEAFDIKIARLNDENLERYLTLG